MESKRKEVMSSDHHHLDKREAESDAGEMFQEANGMKILKLLLLNEMMIMMTITTEQREYPKSQGYDANNNDWLLYCVYSFESRSREKRRT
jgi:hypothetical protein